MSKGEKQTNVRAEDSKGRTVDASPRERVSASRGPLFSHARSRRFSPLHTGAVSLRHGDRLARVRSVHHPASIRFAWQCAERGLNSLKFAQIASILCYVGSPTSNPWRLGSGGRGRCRISTVPASASDCQGIDFQQFSSWYRSPSSGKSTEHQVTTNAARRSRFAENIATLRNASLAGVFWNTATSIPRNRRHDTKICTGFTTVTFTRPTKHYRMLLRAATGFRAYFHKSVVDRRVNADRDADRTCLVLGRLAID